MPPQAFFLIYSNFCFYVSQKRACRYNFSELRKLRRRRPVDAERFDALLLQVFQHFFQEKELLRRWWRLTPREREMVEMICSSPEGKLLTRREVAARLFITPGTAKIHIRQALRKMGARTQADLRRSFQGWVIADGVPIPADFLPPEGI
jgi:DNA-binding CsgD family transcriptional regulator